MKTTKDPITIFNDYKSVYNKIDLSKFRNLSIDFVFGSTKENEALENTIFSIRIASNWRENDLVFKFLFFNILRKTKQFLLKENIKVILEHMELLNVKNQKDEIIDAIVYIIREFKKNGLSFNGLFVEAKDLVHYPPSSSESENAIIIVRFFITIGSGIEKHKLTENSAKKILNEEFDKIKNRLSVSNNRINKLFKGDNSIFKAIFEQRYYI